jgi:hypothetical protein
MAYVLLRSVHPTRLTMQLPQEVAEMIGLDSDATGKGAGHSISFLARGPGIARVLASASFREALAIEVVRDRLVASTRPGEKFLFSVPAGLLRHLDMEIGVRGPQLGRGTDDRILFLMPQDEYHDACAARSKGTPWTGPRGGGMAHVYVVKALAPLPRGLSQLAEVERQIEEEEWRPGVTALQKVGRAR